MTIHDFIAKWRKVELKERSAAQEHFIDLCRVFDHPTPAEADPTGESFCFEKGAARHGGGDGFADVWKRGFSGWEYKGKHKDLIEAYNQLLRYRDALENPPLLVVCDLNRIVVHTNFTGTVSAVHDIPLEALAEPRNIEILHAVFHHPEALRPGRTSTGVTQDAASRFAEIAASMRGRGLDPAAVAHFLDRLVFCLFAEDTRLLPDMVFTRIVKQSAGDPSRFAKLLGQLFDAMATGGDFGLEQIRHFNGNLFDDRTVIDLTPGEVQRIIAAAALDWSAVDPSIFGTLFERGLDPNTRAQLGAHFTSREDIELVVDAVVMSALRREWDESRQIIESLLTTGRKSPGSASVSLAPPKPPREWHSRGYLPHFDHPGLVQTITFRLADSLPPPLMDRLRQERDKQDDPELRKEIEDSLDSGLGACHLRDPRVAEVVRKALFHFDGERYRLLAWTIMPNHVHVMIETLPGARLDEVVHSWKSFTAKECNRVLVRTGAFWQADYYDRYIRDEAHFRKARDYIEQNPVKAGLVKTPAEWRFGSAGSAAILAASSPKATKMVAPPFLKKARAEAGSILHRFLDRLQHVKILDPACGSGNFLYVALLRLKDLEKEAILYGGDRGLGTFLPMVGPSQLHGIEINPYAHDLAQMTVWIGWLQWIRANGFGFPADPILRSLSGNIRRMDAILAPDGTEPEWPRVDFIVGNPPFLGGSKLWSELGREYQERLWHLYDGRVPGGADLCCYWFEKARAHIVAGKCLRAGLLATQAIRGGVNRGVLKRIKESGSIFWAISDRDWVLDGASVNISIVAFDSGTEASRTLDGESVADINADLTSHANTTEAKSLPGQDKIAFIGTKKAGKFELSDDEARALLATPNPHGKPNSDVVRPWLDGFAVTKRPAFEWIIDCGTEMTEGDFSLYAEPFARALTLVKPDRDKNNRALYRDKWWLHAETRPGMRRNCLVLPRYLSTVCHSKFRLFVWSDSICLPDGGVFAFARADDLFFGILHSRIHEIWALKMGTHLETRPRYTPSTCFETFPFPPGVLDGSPATPIHTAIAAAAKELNDLREAWLNPPEWTRTEVLEFPGTVGGPWDRYIDKATVEDRGAFKIGTVRYPRLVPRDAACADRLKARTLTKLYNERPAWLANCHAKLDAAVAAAYGWPADLPDAEILARLLALNQAAAP